MMTSKEKTLDTLVDDIKELFNPQKHHPVSEDSLDILCKAIRNLLIERLGKQDKKPYLRMSNLGTPDRKLWYQVNTPEDGEEMDAHTYIKFLYGDILEHLFLFLAREAFHTVEGEQDQLEINGVKGSRDAVIDGVLVDVKSASTYGYQKFKSGDLRENDPFHYIDQLGAYRFASKDDPLVKEKDIAAFLAIDKQNGHICVDKYGDVGVDYNKVVEHKKQMLASTEVPERCYEDVPQSKTSPNKKLCTQCSYCAFKKKCWPNLRTFIYSNGPVHLTKVVKEPNVFEALDNPPEF